MEELQNVNTQRRCRRPSLDIQSSECELDISYQSLPSSFNNRDEITELENKLEKLNVELQIANSEIDSLNIENSAIKKELSLAQQKINLYKSVGVSELNNSYKSIASPLKFYSLQYRKRFRSSSIKKSLTRTSSKDQDVNTVTNNEKFDESNKLSYFFEQPLKTECVLQNTIISHQPSYRNITDKGNIDMGTIVDAETAETQTVNIKRDAEHSHKQMNFNTNMKSSTEIGTSITSENFC